MVHARIATIALVTALVITLGLGACSTASPRYLPADSAEGYGYHSTRLGEQRYRVIYNGDDRTGVNTTRDYALLRAARLTLEEGYDWFQVVDRETVTSHSKRADSGITYEQGRNEETRCGLLGCTTRTSPQTRGGMDMDTGREHTRHSHALEIVLGKGKVPEGADYYEADAVSRSLIQSM